MKRRYAKKRIAMPIVDPKAVGQRIKACRKGRGLLQLDVAELTGLAPSSIGAYECGTRLPRRDALMALAVALNRTMDFLLLGRHGRRKNVNVSTTPAGSDARAKTGSEAPDRPALD